MATVKYFADDGTEFKTLEDAQRHDARHPFADLVGLGEADIDDMLAGKDPRRAELAEVLGNQLAKARRERGEFKRTPKATPHRAPEPSTAETLPSDVEASGGEDEGDTEQSPPIPSAGPELEDLPI
jgi:hypothetical protein